MAEDRKKVWTDAIQAAYARELQMPTVLSVEEMVEVQRRFQKDCKPISDERTAMFLHSAGYPIGLPRTCSPLWREMMRVNVQALICEACELLETTPWKPWRTQPDPMTAEQVAEARLEVIDALCFLMNCWMLLGGDGKELIALYMAKMEENWARQRRGY